MEYLTLLVPLAAAAVVVILAKRTASHLFRCGHCGKEFRIGWAKVIFTPHSGDEYKLCCPHCKNSGWCIEQTKK